jgi:hypothetical protein
MKKKICEIRWKVVLTRKARCKVRLRASIQTEKRPFFCRPLRPRAAAHGYSLSLNETERTYNTTNKALTGTRTVKKSELPSCFNKPDIEAPICQKNLSNVYGASLN